MDYSLQGILQAYFKPGIIELTHTVGGGVKIMLQWEVPKAFPLAAEPGEVAQMLVQFADRFLVDISYTPMLTLKQQVADLQRQVEELQKYKTYYDMR